MRVFYEIRLSENFSKERIKEFKAGLKACKVAKNLQARVMLYLEKHILPGRFLVACLENNLSDALGYAFEMKWDYVYNVVHFLFSYVPTYCWGSKEIVKSWIKCKK